MREIFLQALQSSCKGHLKPNESLRNHTTLKVGGLADIWFEPVDESELIHALRLAKEFEQKVYVLGGGSNSLIPDEGLKGLLIHLSPKYFGQIELNDQGHVCAGAGLPLGSLLKFLVNHGFGDCEFMMGIPAQVGGALAMNAGSASHWIGDYLIKGRYVTFEGEAKFFDKEEAQFRYRDSGLRGKVVTYAEFNFPIKDAEVTKKKLSEYNAYRMRTQDLKHPNCGCMFANPTGTKSAGQLIDEAGLKGYRIGDAQVSQIHGNFMINVGHARHRDVVALLEHIEHVVYEKYQIQLRREFRLFDEGEPHSRLKEVDHES